MRIYHQIVILVVGTVLAVGLSLTVWSEVRLTRQIEQTTVARDTMIVRLLATTNIDYSLDRDVEEVHDVLQRVVDQAPEVTDAFVVDNYSGIVAHTFENGIPDRIVRLTGPLYDVDGSKMLHLTVAGKRHGLLSYPQTDGSISAVHLLIDPAHTQGLIMQQRQEILVVALLVMTLGALAAVPISRRISAPLRRATEVVSAYGRGEAISDSDLTRLDAGPEVRDLASAFRSIQSELIETAESLKDRQRRLAEVERIAHIGHWRWDRDSNDFDCSSEFREITGLLPGPLRDSERPTLACAHPDDADDLRKAIDQVLHTGTSFNLQHRVVRPSGEERTVSAHAEPLIDGDGHVIGMVGTLQDVTDQVRADSLTHRFGRILDNSLSEIFVFDANTYRFLQVNNGAQANLGYTLEELRTLHPWDIKPGLSEDEFRNIVLPLREGLLDVLAFETVHQRKDGTRYPADVQLQLFKNEQPPVFVAVIVDATERREDNRRQRLATQVFNSVAEGILITDPHHAVVDLNPAFTDITGWQQEDLKGQSTSILKSDRHPPAFYREIADALDAFGHWQGELWDRHKDGTDNPKRASITAVLGDDGEVSHYVAVHTDIAKEKAVEAELNRLAHTDPLTGLPNRALFNDRMEMELKRSARRDSACGLLFVDIDRFKNINDTLGHHAGDQVLREIARRLMACIRGEDTVARLSGDEFTMILGGLEGPANAEEVAQRIVRSLSQPISCDGQDLAVTASVGIALYPGDAETREGLVRCADKAMYAVKQSGRAGYRFYSRDMDADEADAQRMEAELRQALARDELELFFQPRYNLTRRTVIGAEALVRWRHPTRGLVPPDAFISMAEENGLIVPLGRFVLREACRQARNWYDDGLIDGAVSVNLSARQLKDPALIDDIRSILRETRLPPSKLELELTESLVMDDAETSIDRLYDLRDMGLSIAIDDFGTGHSSLAYLKRLPVQALKVDRTFVSDVGDDSDDATIVSAIIGLAHSLGLTVVAEGVETEEQAHFLVEQGCHEIQGYYLSRPVPATEFPKAVSQANDIADACLRRDRHAVGAGLAPVGIERAS